jgi:poly-gamma-glutamate synthesis protein (capsule biosynthesis protein)
MVVARSVATKVAAAFQEIYDSKKFRIYRIALIDEYNGDDDKSMEANNTSAFNCRTTDRGAMSRHASGMAVDINPHSESLPGGKRHVTGGGESL